MKEDSDTRFLGNDAVSYMLCEIRYICQNLKKRAPGSAGEREAAEYMAGKLREECGCSQVEIESFKEHPAAFYGYFWLSAFFDIFSWAGYFIHPFISIISGSLAMLLEKNHIDFEHTEVGVILTGSEEAGLRGAKAQGLAHKNAFQDVSTYIISFDTIHDPKYLAINERDLNGTVKTDQQLGDMFIKAARKIGIPCKRSWVPPFGGSTDSAAFTQAGFHSIGITGLNHKLENFYHEHKTKNMY